MHDRPIGSSKLAQQMEVGDDSTVLDEIEILARFCGVLQNGSDPLNLRVVNEGIVAE